MNLSLLKGMVRLASRVGRGDPRTRELPDCAKVLLLRHDRIGDALVSTSIVDVLARQRPGWQLDILFGRENRHILDHDPRLAARWTYDKGPASAVRLVRSLRAQHYDAVLDLMDHSSTTSMALLRLLEPALTVGFENPKGYRYDLPVPPRPRTRTHVMDRLGDLAIALGCEVEEGSLRVQYDPPAAAKLKAAPILAQLRAGTERLYGLNISAGSESRMWSPGAAREFLETESSAPGARFVVLAHPRDRERAGALASGLEAVEVAPDAPDFGEFAALVQGLDALITPDTSVVHLASAFQIPCVVSFVSEIKSVNWAPYATPHRAVIAPREDFRAIDASMLRRAWRDLLGVGA